jgi:hypothetical protein
LEIRDTADWKSALRNSGGASVLKTGDLSMNRSVAKGKEVCALSPPPTALHDALRMLVAWGIAERIVIFRF